jgi:hypothetical protein
VASHSAEPSGIGDNTMSQELLTDQEVQSLIRALAEGREGKGFTEEEVNFVLQWARKIRIGQTMLELIFTGVPGTKTHVVLNVMPDVDVITRDVFVALHDEDYIIPEMGRNADER